MKGQHKNKKLKKKILSFMLAVAMLGTSFDGSTMGIVAKAEQKNEKLSALTVDSSLEDVESSDEVMQDFDDEEKYATGLRTDIDDSKALRKNADSIIVI